MALTLLSTELLIRVSDFLDLRSLCDVSLVNKQCRSAATSNLFSTLSIKFSSPETFRAKVEGWTAILANYDSTGHVHHLRVIPANLYDIHRVAGVSLQDCGDVPWEAWKYNAVNAQTTEFLSDDAAEWQSLLGLLTTLPALRDITWACEEQIQRCILDYIHKSLSQCRLHMLNFRLRGLRPPPGSAINVSRHEQELATSPCLYSLAMKYDSHSGGRADYNEEAIKDMVAGVAPNLREVNLWRQIGGSDPWVVAAVTLPRQRWQRRFISSSPVTLGSLETINLVEPSSGEELIAWSMMTDFSVLRRLKVHYYLTLNDIRWLTEHCSFQALETLEINPQTIGDDSADDLANATGDFIVSLPRLRNLKLFGEYKQRTVDVVLDRCGANLRSLYLWLANDLFSALNPEPGTPGLAHVDFIGRLQQRCPLLEDLAICMVRTQGSAHETAIYQALGGLSKLRKVHLSIFCSHPLTWQRDWRERSPERLLPGDDGKVRHRSNDVDSALIDLAIDKTLAGSIFRTISSSKAPGARPLERLELRVDALKSVGGFNSSSNLVRLLQYIGQSWICTLNPRDDRPHECFFQEYDPEDQLDREELEEDGLDEIVRRLAPALHRVWPESRHAEWRNVWHSFPLKT